MITAGFEVFLSCLFTFLLRISLVHEEKVPSSAAAHLCLWGFVRVGVLVRSSTLELGRQLNGVHCLFPLGKNAVPVNYLKLS